MVRSHSWAHADHPLVFAHRGGSRLAPENTLAAFDRAVSEAADGLELDVRRSADGEAVVCHDATLDRTTDAKGAIATMRSHELAAVDAGFRFSDGAGGFPFRGRGCGIPTLREVVARYPQQRLIVEIKEDDARLVSATLETLRAAGATSRTCVGSFRASVLASVRSLEPSIATGAGEDEVRRALYLSWIGLFPRRVPYHALQVPERRQGLRIVSPRFVRGAHRAGVRVQVWVVDEERAIRRLLGWGVDALITDRPDVAVRTVRDCCRPVQPEPGTPAVPGRASSDRPLDSDRGLV